MFNTLRLGLGLSGGSAFSPASLYAAGAQGLWLSPSDATTVWDDTSATSPATTGEAVARANDKSGNGNHASQATSAARPLLRNPSGSIYTLDFDGTDDRYGLAGLISSGNSGGRFTCIVGVRALTTGAEREVVGQYQVSGSQRSWRLQKTGSAKTLFVQMSSDGTSTAGPFQATAATVAADNTVVCIVSDGTTVKFYQGLTLIDSKTSTPFGGTAQMDIATDAAGGAFADIEIAELIFVQSVALTDAQRLAATRYVAQKTGVTL